MPSRMAIVEKMDMGVNNFVSFGYHRMENLAEAITDVILGRKHPAKHRWSSIRGVCWLLLVSFVVAWVEPRRISGTMWIGALTTQVGIVTLLAGAAAIGATTFCQAIDIWLEFSVRRGWLETYQIDVGHIRRDMKTGLFRLAMWVVVRNFIFLAMFPWLSPWWETLIFVSSVLWTLWNLGNGLLFVADDLTRWLIKLFEEVAKAHHEDRCPQCRRLHGGHPASGGPEVPQ